MHDRDHQADIPHAPNHHCTVVELDGAGIVIEGPSGSGKSSLGLGLVEAARMRNMPAFLVADDQALLEADKDRLVARVPASIAGKAELHGYGIVEVDHKPATTIALLARLCETVSRMPGERCETLVGISLPMIELPRRHEAQCIRILFAWLESNRAKAVR